MEATTAQLRTERRKERMRLQKRLRDIEKLEAQAAPLQANQIEKVAKKGDVLQALAALGPEAMEVLVVNTAGNTLAKLQMERSSTAGDVSKILVDKGLATLHRHRLVREHKALKPDETLELHAEEDESFELTLVRVASTHLATATTDGNVSLWDLGLGSSGQLPLEGHGQGVTCIKFSPDGNVLLTASQDGTAKLWSVQSSQCLHTLAGFQQHIPVYTADFSPDGMYVVLSQRFGDMHGQAPGVTVWRTRDGKRMRSLYVEGGMVGHGATWSPAGDLIATCSGEFNAWVFCAQTGAPLQYLDHGMSGDCFEASFSPDGRFVLTVAGFDVFVRRAADMWTSNIKYIKGEREIDETLDAPVIFQSQGKAVLSSNGMCACTATHWMGHGDTDTDLTITIVDLNHSECNVVTKLEVASQVVSMEFEPSGSGLLVLTAAEPPSLWSVADGTRIRVFGEYASSRAIWSPDGTLLTTFSNDGKLLLWRSEDAAHLHTFEEPGEVTCATIW